MPQIKNSLSNTSFLTKFSLAAQEAQIQTSKGLLFLSTKEIKSVFPVRMLSGVAAMLAGTVAAIASSFFVVTGTIGTIVGAAIGSSFVFRISLAIFSNSLSVLMPSVFIVSRSMQNIFTLTLLRGHNYFALLADPQALDKM